MGQILWMCTHIGKTVGLSSITIGKPFQEGNITIGREVKIDCFTGAYRDRRRRRGINGAKRTISSRCGMEVEGSFCTTHAVPPRSIISTEFSEIHS